MNRHLNRHLFSAAFVAGLIGLVWVAFGFIDSSLLALAMTAVIAAFYGMGALELRQFRLATASLEAALNAIPEPLPELGAWLNRIHPSLQNAVRLRLEGGRSALPGPALTPYLVGLLVMLGMLGTFLGMVVTLKGAVFALEKTTDLQAMRAALAVPVKGLGLAFGTSVAGVIASAMLGLMSSFSRRERLQAAQLLDTRIATSLRPHSLAYQREESFRAQQLQAQAWPQLLERMQAMMAQMDSMGQQLNQRLLGNQEEFHRQAHSAYTGLARSVEQSLKDNLQQSAQAAGDSLKPVLEATMNSLAREAAQLQERSAAQAQAQLDALATRLAESTRAAMDAMQAAQHQQQDANGQLLAGLDGALQGFNHGFQQRAQQLIETMDQRWSSQQELQLERERQQQQAWTDSLQSIATALGEQWQHSGQQTLAQQQALAAHMLETVKALEAEARSGQAQTLAQTQAVLAQAEDLLRQRIASEAQWMEQHRTRMEQLAAMLQSELGALRSAEAERGDAAVARLGELQAALASHLTTLGTALEEPITRLIHAASEAPRAAAEVIAQLRQEISRSVARDNEVLDERSRILSTLNGLLDAINQASQEQRGVIETLVSQAAGTLQASNQAFAERIEKDSDKLDQAIAQVGGSAIEVASLSEAFGVAVQSYGAANDKLIDNLARIEAAVDKSLARSDEQLAYYLAQAREIIDLSMSSQKEFVEELRRLPVRSAEEAR